MAHLSDEQLLALARDAVSGPLGDHVEGCVKCGQRLEMWRMAIDDLPVVLNEGVNESEMHNLQAMFRHYGPGQASDRCWLGSLVRSSGEAVHASLRGSSTADLFEYEAGPFTMMLESGPQRGGVFPVHGQVFHGGEGIFQGARVVFALDDGCAFVGSLDEFGEFHLDVTQAGRYKATVWTRAGILSFADIDVGSSSVG